MGSYLTITHQMDFAKTCHYAVLSKLQHNNLNAQGITLTDKEMEILR